jgi:endogenous inhibitor of DNA gyrase (YacG/DUF329 family)
LPPAKKVPCPACGTPALFSPENRWRPFCSERCKTIDLGDWASERYRVPTGEEVKDAPEAEVENKDPGAKRR